VVIHVFVSCSKLTPGHWKQVLTMNFTYLSTPLSAVMHAVSSSPTHIYLWHILCLQHINQYMINRNPTTAK